MTSRAGPRLTQAGICTGDHPSGVDGLCPDDASGPGSLCQVYIDEFAGATDRDRRPIAAGDSDPRLRLQACVSHMVSAERNLHRAKRAMREVRRPVRYLVGGARRAAMSSTKPDDTILARNPGDFVKARLRP